MTRVRWDWFMSPWIASQVKPDWFRWAATSSAISFVLTNIMQRFGA